MKKWPETERMYQVRPKIKRITPRDEFWNSYLYCVPKIKLHGTNAGISIENKDGNTKVSYMSRKQVLKERGRETRKSLYGFEEFADSLNVDHVLSSQFKISTGGKLENELRAGYAVNIFGEFCGKGIQSRVACSTVEKFWAPFGILISAPDNTTVDVIVNPLDISEILGEQNDQIRVIPWYDNPEFESDYLISSSNVLPGYSGRIWRIPFSKTNEREFMEAKDDLDRLCLLIEAHDPFMLDEFETDGIGEGMVMFPIRLEMEKVGGGQPTRVVECIRKEVDMFKEMFFKVKGEKHEEKPQKKKEVEPVPPEKKAAMDDFLNDHVTGEFLQQAWSEVFGDDDAPEPQRIPDWLRHCGGKLKQIYMNDFEQKSEFDWNEISKQCNGKVVKYFGEITGM